MENINVLMGNLIRSKRKECGMSTKELSDKLGISAGLLNNIENSKNDTFNIKLLAAMSTLLNINIIDCVSYAYNNETIDNKEYDKDVIDKVKILNNKIFELISTLNSIKSNKIIDKLMGDIEFYKKL